MPVFLEIMRPMNCLMAAIAALIGMMIASGRDLSGPEAIIFSSLVFLSVFAITGAGNAVNDYFDRDIDSINRPGRPIPSGRMTSEKALTWSGILFGAGCLSAGLVNQTCLVIAVLNSILLYFYARNLKTSFLAGNLCVAYLTGSTFIFGGAFAGLEGVTTNAVPFLLSFLATMSREIMKDVEDVEGDRKGGARTLPILAGERLSGGLAIIFSLVAIALSYLAPFGRLYLIVVTFADLFLLKAVLMILKGDAARSQRALKMGMAIALMAFLAGALSLMKMI